MAIALFNLGVAESRRQRAYIFKGRIVEKSPFGTIEIISILFIFSFFSGVRWNVGVDHLSYLKEYNFYAKNGYFERENIEIGYKFIVQALTALGFSAIAFFVTFAFMQFSLIYYRFRNDRYLYPFLGFLIVCGPTYLSMMNGMRQWLAACIFISATYFITQKISFVKYAICILIATAFHQSAIILLPIFFLTNRNLFRNKYLNLSLLIGSLIIGSIPMWYENMEQIAPLLSFIGYDRYAERLDFLLEDSSNMTFGARRMIILFLQILVVVFTPVLSKQFKNRGYMLFFNLFMIHAVWFNLFSKASHIFLRPILYFDFFVVVLLAYLMYYLKFIANKNYKIFLLYWVIIVVSISYLLISCISGLSEPNDFTNYKFIFGH